MVLVLSGRKLTSDLHLLIALKKKRNTNLNSVSFYIFVFHLKILSFSSCCLIAFISIIAD